MKGIIYFAFGLLLFFAGGFCAVYIMKDRFNARCTIHNEPERERQAAYVDSIKNELFIQETTVHRYELSLDHLHEVDPKAAQAFEDFLSHRTE